MSRHRNDAPAPRRSRRRVAVIAVSAAVLASAVGGVAWATLGSKDDQSENRLTNTEIAEAQQQAAEEPDAGHADNNLMLDEELSKVSIGGDKIVDTTEGLVGAFGSDVGFLGASVPGFTFGTVTATPDACLLDWATAALPTFEGESVTSVQTVCDREAAVIAGGYGTVGRDMIGRAIDVPEYSNLQHVIFGHEDLSYASVATTSGGGVLIVVATPPL